MQVILLNESSKKALVRSRRVLSKFLPQIGSATWAGSISDDGLKELRTALKAAGASKNTAVSCLRVEGRGRLVPQWIVGSSAAFDASGRYAFRQTALVHSPLSVEQRSALERLAGALLRLAGLGHDTGKASKAFFGKLKRGCGAEAIRHELLSFLMLAESLWQDGVTDEAWLSRLVEDPAALVACVERVERGSAVRLLPANSKWLARVKDALESKQRVGDAEDGSASLEQSHRLVDGGELEQLQRSAPALATLLWLVLTHHRLPESDRTAQAWWSGRHINAPRAETSEQSPAIADVEACLTMAEGEPPWADKDYLEAVRQAAATALSAVRELRAAGVSTDPGFWPLLSSHYLRPALILADHLGSLRAPRGPEKSSAAAKGLMFANTRDNFFGDTLVAHELAVGRLTRKVTALYSQAWPTTELPAHSLSVTRTLKAPFDWQLGLEDACLQARASGPVFACVIAETGAGKTLAGLRAANALGRGALRLTLALGLRSLTKQSADSMLSDASLDPGALVVAVGQPQTLELVDKAKHLLERTDATGTKRFGSESAEGADVDAAVFKDLAPDLSWLSGFCTDEEAPELWGPKALAMLASPVLACTADYLVSSATMLRGGDAKLYLRLASADLLLDEIDSYSARDLQSIGKLALISGMHGRNVIVMSATMSPAVQAGLYMAWSRGVQIRAALKNKAPTHACVFSSNVVASKAVCSSGQPLLPGAWAEYADSVSATYARTTAASPRRRVRVMPLNLKGTKADAFEVIVQAASELHNAHHTLDAATGVRVSAGFVRLNTAGHAWDLARYLAQRPQGDGPDIKFVSYHAKFPRTYLGVLDATLGALANRKDPEAFLNTPALRSALESTTKKDLLVIVCTTTLMETGRDFDFDWCVLEPRSVRGETQAGGRVLRHRRDLSPSSENVVLLSHPLAALSAFRNSADAKTPRAVWRKPGVEDELTGLRVTLTQPAQAGGVSAPSRLRNLQPPPAYASSAAEALPVAQWARGIDAGLCLSQATNYADNRIGFLEQWAQDLHLCAGEGQLEWTPGLKPPSLSFYLESNASLNQVHAQETKFRGHREEQLVFIPHGTGVRYFDQLEFESTGKSVRQLSKGADVLVLDSARALLPDIERTANQLFTGTDRHIDGCSLRCPWHLGASKSLAWHPLLGFREGWSKEEGLCPQM